ncbi:hypothetical protein [Nonomuraea sp. NPDC049141]|uniref:hypothetical protein n=1 Tax=unclassified Nonomuraea TaxID=2593643 RepID=UPI00340933E5
MSAVGRDHLAAMLDVLVFENVLLVWRRAPFGRYEIVSRDGEETTLTLGQTEMWAHGAFAVYLALVDQGRITPRLPGGKRP